MSAPVRLSPVPPALVDRRKANTSVLVLNLGQGRIHVSMTVQQRPYLTELTDDERNDLPAQKSDTSRMYAYLVSFMRSVEGRALEAACSTVQPCARVDGRQALRHRRAAVKADVRQAQVVQQPLQDVQQLGSAKA